MAEIPALFAQHPIVLLLRHHKAAMYYPLGYCTGTGNPHGSRVWVPQGYRYESGVMVPVPVPPPRESFAHTLVDIPLTFVISGNLQLRNTIHFQVHKYINRTSIIKFNSLARYEITDS